jgi:uncharacterized membrane protein
VDRHTADIVATVRCAGPIEARQALVLLRDLDRSGQIELRGAIVIERAPDGSMQLPSSPDMVTGVTTGGGSLIGMLMKVLGGPLGMLLGWRGAAVIAAAADMRMAERSGELGELGELSVSVRLGNAVVVADVTELETGILDRATAPLGATVVRRPADLVLEELAAAEQAAKAAEIEALRVLREQHMAERRKDADPGD